MDIMLDLETMAATPRAAVASIGAVAFDPYGHDTPETITPDRKFYAVLNMRDQAKLRRDFDPDTIYWWMTQSAEARDTLSDPTNQIPTVTGLSKYSDWVYQTRNMLPHDGHAQRVWCLGATFDHVILQTLFNDIQRRNPFNYPHQLCFRTLAKFADLERPEIPGIVGHNALDDAIKQVIWMQQCIRKIYKTALVTVDTAPLTDLINQKMAELERTNVEDHQAGSQ